MTPLLLCACLGHPASSEPTVPTVHHDLASLNRLFLTPAGLSQVTWAAAPLGEPGLGPTDLRLVAWFPDVGESTRSALLVERLPDAPVPEDVLVVAVNPTLAARADGSRWRTAGLGNALWHAQSAWALDGGVLVELFSE